jgi:hypothetical protein
VMESTSIQKGLFCNGCSMGQNECRVI